MDKNYTIRNMLQQELDIAIDWARQEGWNPGLYEAKCFWVTDPKGFFVGELDGQIIGTISAVIYNDNYGFMGFYIIKPEYRGKGYGMKLFKHAWDYLGNRNKGADGVLENLDIYARVGLKIAHYNARYQGYGSNRRQLTQNIMKLSDLLQDQILEYDDQVFGFQRHDFLKCWINQRESHALGFTKDNKLLGYGVLRRCFEGFKIGPLFSDNDDIAQALFDSLLAQVSSQEKIFFDPPESNQYAVQMAKNSGMKKVFATGRIYTKGQPSFPLKKWYGVTSFELG